MKSGWRDLARFFKSPTRGTHLQPERRSGIRIVTIKNAAWVALSVTVLFIIVSAYMERRTRGTAEYGRLYDRRIEVATPPPAAPLEVIEETPEQAPARSENGRRLELLRETPETAAVIAPAAAPAAPQPVRRRRGKGRVVISGDANGVNMDVQPAAPPPPQ